MSNNRLEVFLDLQRAVQRCGHAMTDAERSVSSATLQLTEARAQHTLALHALVEIAQELDLNAACQARDLSPEGRPGTGR
jgi:hypothetical protein